MTAVCVDDDALMLAQIVSCCRAHRLLTDVQAFTSSPEALAWLKDHTVDLALLDVNMPDMNGLELAGEIRRLHPQTAVIFITAFRQYALEAYAVHPSAYLLKPFDPVSGPSVILKSCWTAGRWTFAVPNQKSCWPIWWIAGGRA